MQRYGLSTLSSLQYHLNLERNETKILTLLRSKMTDVYEGSLIRLFRRLEELLRQMAQAGKVMGSEELSGKFEESLTKIKRDIVAAQSLYL